MCKLVAGVWSVDVFNNGETPGWSVNCGSSAFQIVRFRDTFKPQTHNRGRDRIERILQAEEQILERVEEEPNISKKCCS